MTAIHPLDNYPLELVVSPEELRQPATADEFREELRTIFAADATRRAVGELVAYSVDLGLLRSV